MLSIPNMVIIGGNSRNSGKTTMACEIISKLSGIHEVIGLKVTSVRPGEDEMHGVHTDESISEFSLFEEINTVSAKDTSKMLRSGAIRVFYVKVSDKFIEKAVLHFMSKYINKQVIVCESRSLRRIINPGLFLMMMRLPEEGKSKNDIETFLSLADKVFCSNTDQTEMKQFVDNLQFVNNEFHQKGDESVRNRKKQHHFADQISNVT